MKVTDLKKLLIRSLDKESDPVDTSTILEEAGVTFKFRDGFRNRVMDKIYSAGTSVVREIEFVRDLNHVFYRIALTGAAAIVILLISIFLMQGSLTLNSFLGFADSYDESIICLLTGN